MRVRVVRTSTTPIDEEALLRLLFDAGLALDDIEPDLSIEEEAILDDLVSEEASIASGEEEDEQYLQGDIYVVVLTPECVEDEQTDRAIRRGAISGQMIGIWSEGLEHGRVPPAFERLGGSLVSWNADLLRETIVRGVPTWREPNGDYRAEPKTKRNKC